ncbi:DUF2970 domain-containing protein [Piscinibacterium candidicorallinum]|jgi:hypothetical protein|uniref:DUF2970 domain-containing protein n=1 Tax=Piscinibacterium candidicorallinum TaxID=1793872 RepID=A0ABV7H5P3_9BURK
MDDLGQHVQRKGSFGQTLSAVLWSFFGVRRGADHERDMSSLNPVHVLVIGVLAAAVFVGVLIGIVQMVVGK